METKTTMRTGLNKTPVGAPLAHCSVGEHISPANPPITAGSEGSVSCPHWRSGNNTERTNSSFNASMSGTERVFVLGIDEKPLTPCKPRKARKMVVGGVARVVWNKLGQFGIQMLILTRNHTPKTVLGMDWGSKFEGYSVITGSDNSLNVMWLLPDKKKLVRKLTERRRLRRARRFRNCRRRQARFNNRDKEGFIAPSQLQIILSRLKCIREIMKTYPVNKVAVEDVKFNHRDNKYGKHFSTVEVGKNKIYDYIIDLVSRENLIKFDGHETKKLRNKFGLKKSGTKNKQAFDSHCVDSFVIACEISFAQPNFNTKIVDDTYRPTRRRIHDTQFAKGGIRAKYSTGNYKGIRKGTTFELGQIVGGTEKVGVWYRDWSDTKQKGKSLKKISWYSKQFKWRNATHPHPHGRGLLASHCER